MKRILFVDDEVKVLDGIRLLLRKHRVTWDMTFATGGAHALELVAEQPFDVVVTDLRMPRVDGITLLRHLRDHHPQTMRIVLSGDAERSTALAFVPYAHQSLTKPCRLVELESVLARACRLGELVSDLDVRSVIGRLGDLPSIPTTYARLLKVLDSERSSADDVAAVIASDIAVTAKTLQLANSTFFGAGRATTTVVEAIRLLGMETLKSLTLSTALRDASTLASGLRTFAEDLHEHSWLVADLASRLAAGTACRDAFSAGILHDVGRLVLASTMPEERAEARSSGAPSHRHAKVGAYLLGLWGLPLPVIDAVARHHDAPEAEASPLAYAIAQAERIVDDVTSDPRPSAIDIAEMQRRVVECGRRASSSSTERAAP